MSYKLIPFYIIIMFCVPLYAQTYILGGTIDGAVWTPENSPYRILSDVSIKNLLILPGVTVEFTGNSSFEVDGFLQADGHHSDSIYFRPTQNNDTGWEGIIFKNSASDASSITYCRIEGTNAQGIFFDKAHPTIKHCRITGNTGDGIRLKDTRVRILNCDISYNDRNGAVLDVATLILLNSIVSHNDVNGLLSTDASDSIEVVNTVIADNMNTGVSTGAAHLKMMNSIIYYNQSQISSTHPGSEITYCDIEGNPVQPGTGNVNVQPDFVDRMRYHLSAESDLIDAGHPASQYEDRFFPPSLATQLNDMGAYGGPRANGWYPPLYVKPENIDFGRIRRDSTSIHLLKVHNYREDVIYIDSIKIEGKDSLAFQLDQSYYNLPPSDTLDLTLSFTPNALGVFQGNLILETRNKGMISHAVSGEGVVPEIEVVETALNFGTVSLGDSALLDLHILNLGGDTLLINLISPSDSAFSVQDSFLVILPDVTLDTIQVKFKPQAPQSYDDFLIILSNDPDEKNIAIPLSGTGSGPVIQSSKDSLDFGLVPVGSDSSLWIRISNRGNDTLTVENLAIANDDKAREIFRMAEGLPDLPWFVEPDSSYLLEVIFEPVEAGAVTSQFSISSNDPFQQVLVIDLNGIGVIPEISFSSLSLDFGSIPLSEDSSAILTIFNTGQANLTVYPDSLYIDGNDAGSFTLNGITSNLIIPPGDSTEIELIFTPAEEGIKQAQLNVGSNDPARPQVTVTLGGEGIVPGLSFSTSELDFGSVHIYADSSQMLYLYNTGQAELVIYKDSLQITGPNSAEFNIGLISENIVLSSGDSAVITIRFHPENVGLKQAQLNVGSNDPSRPQATVALGGEGVAPGLYASSGKLEFGLVPLHSDSSQTLYLYNTGQAELIVYEDSLKVYGPDSTEFRIEKLKQEIITPGDSVDITVHFQPDDLGIKQAQLRIVSNDPFNPTLSIMLTGTGADRQPASIAYAPEYSSSQFVDHQPGTLGFTISAVSVVDSAFLHVRKGGEFNYSRLNLNNVSQEIWIAEIDSSMVTSRGLEYFVQAFHGWRLTQYPEEGASLPNAIQVDVPELLFPYQTKREIYQMISLPILTADQDLNQLFADDLGSYDITQYRFFDCTNGSKYTELVEMNSSLPPGKALWLITKEPKQLDVSNGQSVLTDQDFDLKLKQGWNLIANPFNFPVDWNQISPDDALRYYDGTDWTFASVLEPFKGYAVYAQSPTNLTISPRELVNINFIPKISSDPSGKAWQFRILAQSFQQKDEFNYAGVRPEATSGTDKFDFVEPPPIGNYISLYFLHGADELYYSTDYREPGAEGYTFQFELNSNIQRAKSVQIFPENLPQDFDWLVVSPETGVNYGKETITILTHRASFHLLAGTAEYLAAAAGKYQNLPLTFKLNQNYPNPFNPETVIDFRLPQQSKVTIQIFNILGKRVKTLMNNERREAGYYQVKWDGTNDRDIPVASGIYILNFDANNYNQSIKMIMQR